MKSSLESVEEHMFKYSSAIETWLVPQDASYQFVVRGAAAADGGHGKTGGTGAVIHATFKLTAGMTIKILCGGKSTQVRVIFLLAEYYS